MRKLAIALLAALLCWAYPAIALSKEITADEPIKTVTGPVTIPVMSKEDAPDTTPSPPQQNTPKPQQQSSGKPAIRGGVSEQRVYGGRHSTRAEKQISELQLQEYLSNKGSPLAPYASQILASPHWSTVIGICTIEQYGCTRAPYNNYWGIMCGGKVCQYATPEEGINAISGLLARYETKGKDTIEELNGYYVQPASANWYNTVLKTKRQVENL